jgi:ribosomal protein S18 acetylase RimI-like enzyme
MQLRLRRAAPIEAPQLTALARAAKASWGYPAEWLDEWQGVLTLGEDYIATHEVLVAETAPADGSLLGVCALEEHESDWTLEHVWVAPSVHRAGVGRALVQRALAIAGGRRPGSVVRVESDPQAAGFYRRLGAREAGAVPAPMPGAPARVLPVFEFTVPAIRDPLPRSSVGDSLIG